MKWQSFFNTFYSLRDNNNLEFDIEEMYQAFKERYEQEKPEDEDDYYELSDKAIE